VYDLYTGTGTIAQFVSKRQKKVLVSKVFLMPGRQKPMHNNIDNCEFYVGDMKVVFNDDFIAQHGHPDVIITDPPRDGMHKDVIEQIMLLLKKLWL
jgi:23S rRNA (uracil1939-C5)-methyltransferase